MILSSASICQSDTPQENFFFPSVFHGIHLFHCPILCLLPLHLLLVLTATLLFMILSYSELSDPVSDSYYKLPLSFHHLSSFIFSQICFSLNLIAICCVKLFQSVLFLQNIQVNMIIFSPVSHGYFNFLFCNVMI